MSRLRWTLLCLALAGQAPGAAASTVWKCAADGGGVVYQDAPCPPGKELRNLDTDPPPLSIVPGTPVPAGRPPQAATTRPERAAAAERRHPANGDAAERRFIHVGMSEAEVIQRIGRPDVDARNQRGQGQRWSYLPNNGDPNTITTLTLVGGRVTYVERKIVR